MDSSSAFDPSSSKNHLRTRSNGRPTPVMHCTCSGVMQQRMLFIQHHLLFTSTALLMIDVSHSTTNTFDSSSQLLERIIPGHFRNDYPNKILEQSTGLHLSAQVIFLIMEFVSVEHDEPFTFSMKTSRSCVCVRTCVGALVSGQDRIHLPIWEPISGNAHIWTYVCQSHMSLVPFMPIYGEP